MQETLTPILGSNQFVTKFDEKAKAKKKFKVKISFMLKIKIVVCLLLAVSLYLNYHIIKDNYLWTCSGKLGGVEQTQWGHFGHLMKKTTCDQIIQMRIDSLTQQPNTDEN